MRVNWATVGVIALFAENAHKLSSDMPKGKKRMRGEPVYHDELKKSLNLTVTPTGAEGLETITQELGLRSKSELVDRIGQRLLLISSVVLTQEDCEELSKSSRTANCPS